jgi:hypothetical protein
VPPTFGAFTKTVYAYDNVVIGQPLAYQYLLSLRPNAVPETADDLLRMRGRGWLSNFPVGDLASAPGVPVVNTSRYDTGVQVHGVASRIEWTGAVTTGSLSDPRLDDNNGDPQFAGRLTVQVAPGLRLGASGARGAWLDHSLDAALPTSMHATDFSQTAVALDAEMSHGAWLTRVEWLRSSWGLPPLSASPLTDTVVAESVILEGRYRLGPGISVAVRGDALAFSDVAGAGSTQTWEAGVRRLEAAVSVAVTRNITTKVAWQVNRRDGGRVRHDSLLAAQVVYWF